MGLFLRQDHYLTEDGSQKMHKQYSPEKLNGRRQMMIFCAWIVSLPAGLQTTPASLTCPQSWTPHPSWPHCVINVSFPIHLTLSSHVWPIPCPNVALLGANKAPSYPSWRQTTSASCKSQELPQMVPHVPLYHTSTRPEDGELLGLTKRTMIRKRDKVADLTNCI